MNPNVGLIINGNAVLDRDTFARTVEPALRLAVVNSAPLAQWGQTIMAAAQMTDDHSFTNLYTSGRASFTIPGLDFSAFLHTYQDSEGQWNGSVDLAGVAGYIDAKLADPNTLFILDSEEPGNNYHNRRRTLYFRKNNVVLPISTKTYYESSTWIDSRAGVIFVFGIVFSLVGAPVLTSAMETIAAGGSLATVSVVAPTATAALTTAATSAGSLLGDSRIGAATKIISLASGRLSSTDALQAPAEELVDDYADAFDPFGYSSGEATDFFGDAQNVDYGFGGNYDYGGLNFDSNTGWTADALDMGVDADQGFVYGATPEVTTNQFGTSFDEAFGDTSLKTATDGLALYKAATGLTSDGGKTGVTSGGKATSVAKGSNDVLSTFSSVLSGLSGAAKAIGGTSSQKTTAQQRAYSGQLTPTGGVAPSTVGGVNMNTILLIGAGILAVGFLMKKG